MKFSPLQVINYSVTEFSFKANPKFDPKETIHDGCETFSTAVEAQQDEEVDESSESWILSLRVRQEIKEGSNFPYSFTVSIFGLFDCKKDVKVPGGCERFVKVNGSSILFGVVRELIRSMTACAPWNELMLPVVSFVEDQPKRELKAPTERKLRVKRKK